MLPSEVEATHGGAASRVAKEGSQYGNPIAAVDETILCSVHFTPRLAGIIDVLGVLDCTSANIDTICMCTTLHAERCAERYACAQS